MERDRSTERLAALTDGVVAIVMTLLALDVRLPVSAEDLDDAGLIAAFEEALPTVYAYALSFVVIALFWLTHHRKFAGLRRVDSGLFWLNILFLLLIGLIPFVTAVLAENSGSVATAVYAGVMAAVSASLAASSIYASTRNLLEGEAPGSTVGWVLLRSLMSGGVFLLSIPIAFYDASAAQYFWLLLIPTGFLMRASAPAAAKAP
jgi:uncharacterized membrane protein